APRRDPLAESSIAILPESSTTTATIFCCGRSVATLSAGCQSIRRRTDASAVWSNQTKTDRTPATRDEPLVLLLIRNPRAIAATRIAAPRSHTGHPPSSTKLPREKTELGYLKRSSNIDYLLTSPRPTATAPRAASVRAGLKR